VAGVVIGVAGTIYATNEEARNNLPKAARDLPDNIRRRYRSAVAAAREASAKNPCNAKEGIDLPEDHPQEYAYLRLPPHEELRSCVGLVLAGMAARARVGVGGLEEAVEVLEGFHAGDAPTRFRFSLSGERVLAEVEEPATGGSTETSWRTVVELVS
jgi:hypothetical protein